MGKLENFRKILTLPEVIESVELTNKLRELQEDYFELLEDKNELQERLNTINDISDIKKKAKINSGFYTIDEVKDIHNDNIPFCLNCLYEHNLQIPMMLGIIERGKQELYSGKVIIPSTYGLSCNKCGTKIAFTDKGDKNNG